jgi:hypothetical protein
VSNLSLFDTRPVALARPEAQTPELTNTSIRQFADGGADVLRTITTKHGAFRELGERGIPTGREFVIVELQDGRIFWQFPDGSRAPATRATTRTLIDDCVRAGEWREVRG